MVRQDGRTLGKGLVGLAVVPSGQWARLSLEVRQAAVRMVVIFVPFFFMSLSGSYPTNRPLDVLAVCGMLSLLASLLLAAIPIGARRTAHDFITGTRVVRATPRNIHWRTDLPMVLPGRVDMVKRL
ncbi:RDD family protein [Nocardia takedensis]